MQGKAEGSFRDWLSSSNFAVEGSKNKGELLLTGIDSRALIAALAADINRFSSAGYETLCNIRHSDDLPKSNAWPLIKLYYATFYYVHSVLRTFGDFPAYLSALDLTRLNQTAIAYGVTGTQKLSRGSYRVQISASDNQVRISPLDAAGGTHEVTWKEFSRVLKSVSDTVADQIILMDSAKKMMLLDVALLSKAATKTGANATWLSTFRNAVQYRHEYSAWAPYGSTLKVSNICERVKLVSKTNTKLDTFHCESKAETHNFIDSCLMIIFAIRNSILSFDKEAKKSFLRHGMLRSEELLSIE